MEKNEFEKAFIIMFAVTLFLLIGAMFTGAMILPEDNPSHKMNPFSISKNWLMEDTARIGRVATNGALGVVILAVISASISHAKRKE